MERDIDYWLAVPVERRPTTEKKRKDSSQNRWAIQQELIRRGVARDVTDSAIADVFAEEHIDEEGTLERVARKKLKSLARLDTAVQRRRLYAFLARRGYDSDDIARTVRSLMSSEPPADAPAAE